MPADLSQDVASRAELFPSDAAYLITGGLGAIGLTVAEWLVQRGARSVVLMGRRGISARAEDALERIRQAGGQVMVVKGDVTLVDDLTRVLEAIERSTRRLRGVFHAAGIVDDGLMLRLDRDRLESVMAPKVVGAWNLHSTTRDIPLDFFVLFSSGVSLMGSPGLGNYAAANAFLDALAHHRHAEGLPALSVNWAHWRGVGMAKRADVMSLFSKRGVEGLSRSQGLEALGFLLAQSQAQVAVMPIDWRQYVENRATGGASRLVESLLRAPADVTSDKHTSATPGSPGRAKMIATSPERRSRAALSVLVEQAAAVLNLPESRVDIRQPLSRQGLDSLMAVEMRNRTEIDLGVGVPVVRFLEGASLEEIAREISDEFDRLTLQGTAPAAAAHLESNDDATCVKAEDAVSGTGRIDAERAREILARVSTLSGATVDALLDQLMERSSEVQGTAAR